MVRLLLTNSCETKRDDRQIFPDLKDSVSTFSIVCCVFSFATGAHDLLGPKFGVGVVGGVVLNALVAGVTVYGTYLYFAAVAHWRLSLLEHVWVKAFGRLWIVVWLISLLTVVCQASAKLDGVTTRVMHLLSDFVSQPPHWLMEQRTLLLIVLVAAVVPVCSIFVLGPFVHVARVGCVVALYILGHAVFWFVWRLRDVGFDPDSNFRLFRFDRSLLFSLRLIITDYQIVPISWPGPKHLRNATPNRLLRAYGLAILCLFVFLSVRESFGYLTLCGADVSQWLRDNWMGLWYVKINEFCQIIAGIASLIAGLNPGRFILLNAVDSGSTVPEGIWGIAGFAIALLSMPLIGVGDIMNTIIEIVHTVGICCLTFIIPGLVFIKSFGTDRLGHSIGAGILVLIGLVFVVLTFYDILRD
jgi:hypothetical protein